MSPLGRQQVASQVVSEAGPPADQPIAAIATDYVHVVHPDTGVAVVFVPGETLPAWAAPAESAADGARSTSRASVRVLMKLHEAVTEGAP